MLNGLLVENDAQDLMIVLHGLKLNNEESINRAMTLLEKNPQLGAKADPYFQLTPLMAAVGFNNAGCSLDIFQRLLKKPTLLNAKNNKEYAILHFLAAYNRPEHLKYLLQQRGKEVELDILTKNQESPVSLAAYYGHSTVLYLLLNAGANIHIPNHKGQTPLHLACAQDHLDCVRGLLQAGAKVDVRDNMGKVPGHYVAKSQSAEIMQLLQEYGADMGAKSTLGNQPWQIAANLHFDNFSQAMKNEVVPTLFQMCIKKVCTQYQEQQPLLREQLPEDILDRLNNTQKCNSLTRFSGR